jgi:hypothetical protein
MEARRETIAVADVALERRYVSMALEHFLQHTEPWLLGQCFQRRLQEHGLRLGLESEYVLHAVLAVSASHLHHMNPPNRDLDIFSHCHYSLALELYQEKLQDFRARDLDSMYVCAMIQIIMTVKSTVLDTVSGGEVLGGYDVLLAGIKIMNGFQALVDPFQGTPEVSAALFHDLFERCSFPAHFSDYAQGARLIPSTIAPLEGLIRLMIGDDSFRRIYQGPFEYLVQISKQEPQIENLDISLSFSSQLKGDYLKALETKDPMALLLLCYWFSFLARIQQWWVTDPSRTFCERFYVHLLDTLPVPILERNALLAPAAQAIGWTLSQ